MTALRTTVYVGPDGILRLEMPVEERNRDVTVTITVEDARAAAPPTVEALSDPWAGYRQRLEAAGLRVPAPGSWSARRAAPLEVEGRSASESLVEERR